MANHLVSAQYTYYPHGDYQGTIVMVLGAEAKAAPADVNKVKRLQAKLMKMPGATYTLKVNQFDPSIFTVDVEVGHHSWG